MQPIVVETFKLSRDPHFVKKLRDVVGIYLSPPRRAWVLVWMVLARCAPTKRHSEFVAFLRQLDRKGKRSTVPDLYRMIEE